MRKLRLGIIGTGVAARRLHWPALERLSDRYQIVAVANRTRDKGEAFADLVGLDRACVYEDYRQLLGRGDVEVVDLVLPPALNYEGARAAAASGIHVVCEKPIAVTMKEARAMVALPQEFGVQILIAENFRYENAVRLGRSLIEQGELSAPFMMCYQWMQHVPQGDEMASRPWRREAVHAGGCLSDHGVHMIDVARYLMGEIRAVQAFGLHVREHLGGIDSAAYNLRFESGAIGSIQWSFGVASRQKWLLQMWSDDGSLEIEPDEIRLCKPDQPEKVFTVSGPTSFVNEFEDFYEALVNGKKPLVTARDALKDLEAILAVYRSAVVNEVVLLGEEERS